MQVNITFRGMDSTDSLKNYTRERVEHVTHYLDKATEAHVVLSLERYLHHADITIYAGKYVLRGRDKSADMYKSIEAAVDKIEKQLQRYKGRMRSQKHRNMQHHNKDAIEDRTIRHNVLAIAPPEHAEGEEWTQGPKVIKSNDLIARPMTVDEAVMQMDLMHNDFLVFLNAETADVNVVYRRSDGHFGLIETAAVKGAPAELRNGKTAEAR